MEFKIRRKPNPNVMHYADDDLNMAYEFSKGLYKEMENFIKAIVLFGATARKASTKEGDIDILVIVDDVSIYLSAEFVEAYRIIAQKIIAKVSTRLHVTTLRFSSFWEYVRAGDPVAINILRDGLPLIDTGFFEPLQVLLKQGRIRPTAESIWAYYGRAPSTLFNSRWHLLQATLDLYWAVIDSAHAALMNEGEIPPTPGHVADMIEGTLVKKGLVDKRYADIMKNFYKLAKMITHREVKEIRGEEYERYYRNAEDFVNRMKELIDGKKKYTENKHLTK